MCADRQIFAGSLTASLCMKIYVRSEVRIRGPPIQRRIVANPIFLFMRGFVEIAAEHVVFACIRSMKTSF